MTVGPLWSPWFSSVESPLHRIPRKPPRPLDAASDLKTPGPGANLRGADLRLADLKRRDLSGADLREADLSEARVEGCRFTGAVFDDHTRLPFPKELAKAKGMIEDVSDAPAGLL